MNDDPLGLLNQNKSESEDDPLGLLGTKPEPAQEEGFFSRVGQRLKERGATIARETGGTLFPVSDEGGTAGEKQLRAVGQVLQVVPDIAIEGLRSGYRALPEKAQTVISEPFKALMQTPLGREGVQAFYKGQEAWAEFSTKYPNIAKDIEAFFNIGSVLPVTMAAKPAYEGAKAAGKAIQAVGKGAAEGVADISTGIAASIKGKEGIEKAIQGTIENTYEKAIRPSISSVGKSTPLRKKYYSEVKTAVEDIVENKNTLSLLDKDGVLTQGMLPKSADNMLDAVSQGKQRVYREYDAMKQAAGEAGATVDITPLLNKYKTMLEDRMLPSTDNTMYKYLQKQYDALSGLGGNLTVDEAQKTIAALNEKLKPVYGKVGYGDVGVAHVDAVKATELRKALDAAITKEAGPGYQALKKQYGAYRQIEDDVARRVNQIAGQPPKGIFDLSDVWVGYHIMYASLTGNVPSATSGVFAHFLKNRMKALRDPDRNIEKMFSRTDNLIQQRQKLMSEVINYPAIIGKNPFLVGTPISHPNWEYGRSVDQVKRTYKQLPDTIKQLPAPIPDTIKQLPAPNKYKTVTEFLKAYKSASKEGKEELLKTLSGTDRQWIPFIRSGRYKNMLGKI